MLRFLLSAAIASAPAVCSAGDTLINGSKLIERCETISLRGKTIGYSCIDIGADSVLGNRTELAKPIASPNKENQTITVRQ